MSGLVAACLLTMSIVGGEPPTIDSNPALPAGQVDVSPEHARASVQWLATLAIEKAPRDFHGDKDWGEQKKLWAGIRVKRDGLKLKTHRRWKHVNHGRWIRYEAQLPAVSVKSAGAGTSGPAAKIHSVTQRPDAVDGHPRWQIDSSVTSPLTFAAQVQRWNVGLKLYSVTIRGVMRVRLDSRMSVAFVTDYSEVPPAFVIDPRVENARLELEHFEVERVSHIGGDVAEEWGELLEDLFRDRFLKRQNEKIVDKLNRAIDRERDDLRLSMAEWLSEW